MSVDHWCMTIVLSLFFLAMLFQPASAGTSIMSPSESEQLDKEFSLETSSKIEDFDFGPKNSIDRSGFISPSSLHTLHVKGPALTECKSVCRLVLRMITNKTDDEAPSALGSSYRTASCSLKSLLIFSSLRAGKYVLSTRCDADHLCYTDPAEKIFEVDTKDGGPEMIHLGSLTTLSGPPRNITEEPRIGALETVSYYNSTYEDAWPKYWQALLSIGVTSSLVALGLVLISFFEVEGRR